MRKIKFYVMGVMLLLSVSTNAQHSYPKPQNNADSEWSKLVNIMRKRGDTFLDILEKSSRYREEGLKFWKRFPNDQRRYKWLYNTIHYNRAFNSYLKIENGDESYKELLDKGGMLSAVKSYQWPLNRKPLEEWEKVFPELKKDFLTYLAKKPEIDWGGIDQRTTYEMNFLTNELSEFLILSLNKNYRKGNKIDVKKIRDLFLSSGKYLMKENHNIPTAEQGTIFNIMDGFISIYQEYGLTAEDMNALFNSIKSSSVPVLRNWGIQRGNLFALMKDPLSFKHVSMTGDTIDLEKMKGKVVLVDFWALTCSFCIERMPAIKVVYDKYKDKGFEVLSVCLETEVDRERVETIEKKIGSDWPILLVGSTGTQNSLGQQIFRKYGFWGVPQLLLLNKEGKLVMLNDKLRYSDFEPDVKRLLDEPYPKK